jgi:hypothetical protein
MTAPVGPRLLGKPAGEKSHRSCKPRQTIAKVGWEGNCSISALVLLIHGCLPADMRAFVREIDRRPLSGSTSRLEIDQKLRLADATMTA